MSITEKTNVIKTNITRQQMGDSYLDIYTKTFNDEIVLEAFTLSSLAEVLNMPMSTMEGRYARAKLHRIKVDIPMRSGRPTRGFPVALLEQVIQYVTTPGVTVHSTPNSDEFVVKERKSTGSLVPVYHDNKPYFTIAAMAEHFGYSATTIRNKLQKAGLMRRLVSLGSSMYGGRPTRAMPESSMGDVRMAIENGAKFQTELDRILTGVVSMRQQGKAYTAQHMPSHTPPARGSMRAWDSDSLAPVVPFKPLNSVNSRPTMDIDAMSLDLEAELESIVRMHSKPVVSALPTKAPPPAQPVVEDDAATIKQKAWAWQLEALSSAEEEPTTGDLRDTCEMMELDKAESERFVSEVAAARRQRVAV